MLRVGLWALSLGAARQEDDSCNCARRSRSRRLFLLSPQMSMETDGHGGAKWAGPASGQEPEWVRGSESFSAGLVRSLPPNGTHQHSQCTVSLVRFSSLSRPAEFGCWTKEPRSQVKQPKFTRCLPHRNKHTSVSKFDKRRRTLGDAATAPSALYPQTYGLRATTNVVL
jgi:hypothetical protein